MNTYFLHVVSYALDPIHDMFVDIKDAFEEHVVVSEREFGEDRGFEEQDGRMKPCSMGESVFVFRSRFSIKELDILIKEKKRDIEYYFISLKEPDMIIYSHESPLLDRSVQVFFKETSEKLEKLLTDDQMLLIFRISELLTHYKNFQNKRKR